MKKAVFALGLGYIFWGLWLLASAIRLGTHLQKFNTDLPLSTFLLLVGVLIYGAVLLGSYFVNFRNKKIYLWLLVLGLSFAIFWLGRALVNKSIADEEMRQFKKAWDEYPLERGEL